MVLKFESDAEVSSHLTPLQLAVLKSCPHTISQLLEHGGEMKPFVSGKSMLDQLVIDENVCALDYLFHKESLWFENHVQP